MMNAANYLNSTKKRIARRYSRGRPCRRRRRCRWRLLRTQSFHIISGWSRRRARASSGWWFFTRTPHHWRRPRFQQVVGRGRPGFLRRRRRRRCRRGWVFGAHRGFQTPGVAGGRTHACDLRSVVADVPGYGRPGSCELPEQEYGETGRQAEGDASDLYVLSLFSVQILIELLDPSLIQIRSRCGFLPNLSLS